MKRWIAWLLVLLLTACAANAEALPAQQETECLKQAWKALFEQTEASDDGVIEIKNTRIVHLYDDFGDNEAAEKVFGGIDYIVEYLLYSDLYGGVYTVHPDGMCTSVAVYDDGRMEALNRDLFSHYRGITYSFDYSGIVERIEDLGGIHNGIFCLTEE